MTLPIHRNATLALIVFFAMLVLVNSRTAEAGCLNCNFPTRAPVEEETDTRYEQEDTRVYSGSLRTKIRRLDDNAVDDLVIPVLLGVSLDDLFPNFGDPRGGGTRSHEGFDILAPKGTPIISPTDAVVTRVGSGVSSGKYVSTANPGGETFIYMHLDAYDVRAGDVLRVGDLIGYVGDTGNAKGGPAHLHLEIRDGRKATDPYPRITKEVTLKNTMTYLTRILTNHDEESAYAEFLAETFEPVFVHARTTGVALPRSLQKIVSEAPAIFASTQRDLTLGTEGADVSALQSFLIGEGYLDIASPTGSFGPLTEAALRELQRDRGISATGYFGPATRSALNGPQPAPDVATSGADDEITPEALIRLLVQLNIISKDNEAKAQEALSAMSAA